MRVREHTPIVIDRFNGVWDRDRVDSVPLDHFQDSLNVVCGQNQVKTRDGIDTVVGPGEIIRMYRCKFTTPGEGLIALDANGDFWHQRYDPDNTYLILSVPTATDFVMVEVANRAYISPITGIHGTDNEFLYVYKGDGTSARKAAGNPPVNTNKKPFLAYNSEVDGKVDMGIHVIAVSYDSAGNLSTALGPTVYAVVYAPGNKEININNIPTSGVLNRRIYMTRAIDPKDWNPAALPTFYLAKTIADATTVNTIISVTDAELVTAFAAGGQAVPSDGGALNVANSATDGYCDLGLHIYAVVYETDTGYLTAPGPEFFAVQTHVNEKKRIDITGIPVSPNTFVTKRHIVVTKAINPYNGDQSGFQFFFVPDGNINDNTSTTKSVSFYDADLLEDASHLIDNFAEIPAGTVLTTYNGRLVMANTFDFEGTVWLSAPGEPEAIDQVDGVLIPPNTTEQVNNAQEFRDVLYIFKDNRTYSYVDNGDVPSLWAEPTTIDNGIGTSFHGVSTVLDSRGVNIEYLVITHEAGLYLFTGTYIKPELSWKFETRWRDEIDVDEIRSGLQIFTDSINKIIYILLPDGTMWMVGFSEGFDAKNVKWHPWEFPVPMSTIALMNGTRLLLAAEGN